MLARCRWWCVGMILCGVLAPAVARAGEHYVDPLNGSMDNDGSAAQPWSTLQEVLEQGLVETREWDDLPYDEDDVLVARNPGAPVKAGDTIWLRSGYHGAPLIESAYNELPITIAAEAGHSPQVASLEVRAASNWIIKGLSVSPSHAPVYSADTMVSVASHGFRGPAYDVVVEGCSVFSVQDTSAWTLDDWNNLAASGVSVSGDRVTIRENHLLNVNFGISVSGVDGVVERNVVENFAGDGLRGLGDGGRFEGNTIKNCYDVNDNHDDGFQSWSVGDGGVGTGVVRGIVLRGNTIINYEDPAQPFRGPLQGIGCFDGFFEDWVVENNVIITDHWHGISLLGVRDSRIVNNTVIDRNSESPGPPWIMVAPHKDDRPSENVLVRNNLATDFSLAGTAITEDHNLEITVSDLAAHFAAPPLDVHLVEGSSAINAGSADRAPAVDIEGVPRPQEGDFDIGAYEYHSGPIEWPDAGTGPSSDGGMGGGDGAPSADGGGAGASGDGSGCGCRAGAGPFGTGGGGALVGLVLAWCLAPRRRSS